LLVHVKERTNELDVLSNRKNLYKTQNKRRRYRVQKCKGGQARTRILHFKGGENY